MPGGVGRGKFTKIKRYSLGLTEKGGGGRINEMKGRGEKTLSPREKQAKETILVVISRPRKHETKETGMKEKAQQKKCRL